MGSGRHEIRTRGCWVRSKNATSLLCAPSPSSYQLKNPVKASPYEVGPNVKLLILLSPSRKSSFRVVGSNPAFPYLIKPPISGRMSRSCSENRYIPVGQRFLSCFKVDCSVQTNTFILGRHSFFNFQKHSTQKTGFKLGPCLPFKPILPLSQLRPEEV